MSLATTLLEISIKLLGRLPLPALHRLGTLLGHGLWLGRSRARRDGAVNLALAFPESTPAERDARLKRVLAETGKSLVEVARIWGRPTAETLALVREVRGLALFDAALASGRGLIVAAPHLGCWELLNFYLGSRAPLAIVYRAPRRAALEPLLVRARGALQAEQIRAEGAGVRALYRRLQGGGMVGILPDQQPRQGEGEFAPFFGVPALTMVLVPRLAHRTGATVLFSFAERLPAGEGFRIHFLPAPDGIASPDLAIAVAALNTGVEQCARLAHDQYQWGYKRFSIRPEGDGRKLY